MFSYRPPHMAKQKQGDQLKPTQAQSGSPWKGSIYGSNRTDG